MIAPSTFHHQLDLLYKFLNRSSLSIKFLYNYWALSDILSLEQKSDCSAIWNDVTIHQPYLVIVFYHFIFRVRDGSCIEIYLVFRMADKSKLDTSTLRTFVNSDVFMTNKYIMQNEVTGYATSDCKRCLHDFSDGEVKMWWNKISPRLFIVITVHFS